MSFARATWTLIIAGGAAGCILPVATGTPQGATTAGRGRATFSVAGEMPTVDLLADDPYDIAPAAAGTITAGYGVTERTDVEVAAEASLYWFVMPIPTGASVGVRHHLVAREQFDVGIAGRIGGVTVDDGDDGSASAVYGAASITAQAALGPFRPLVSGQLMPTRITQALGTDRDGTSSGLVTSATLGLMFQVRDIQVGPYLTGTAFSSDAVARNTLVSGGVAFAYRPDRHASRPVAAPAPAAFGGPGAQPPR